MYVATWGSGNILDVSTTYHQAHYLKFLRAFIEAVLKYTGSQYVNIVAHGMGVTMARKAIKGGEGSDAAEGG